MNGYNNKYGAYMNKEDKKNDIIFGIKKYSKVGLFSKVYLLEKELIEKYGMTEDEIDKAVFGEV